MSSSVRLRVTRVCALSGLPIDCGLLGRTPRRRRLPSQSKVSCRSCNRAPLSLPPLFIQRFCHDAASPARQSAPAARRCSASEHRCSRCCAATCSPRVPPFGSAARGVDGCGAERGAGASARHDGADEHGPDDGRSQQGGRHRRESSREGQDGWAPRPEAGFMWRGKRRTAVGGAKSPSLPRVASARNGGWTGRSYSSALCGRRCRASGPFDRRRA